MSKTIQPTTNTLIKIPLTEQEIALCYIAHVSKEGFIFILGFPQIFLADTPLDELQKYAEENNPKFAISTTTALLDIGKWHVLGTIHREDHNNYFPAYKKRKHPEKIWVIEDYTAKYQRVATEAELENLSLRTTSTPASMTNLILAHHDRISSAKNSKRKIIPHYPLAKDYFTHYRSDE